MAYNYVVCNGTDAIVYSVTGFTLSGSESLFQSGVYFGGWYFDYYHQYIKINLNKPAHASFTINYVVTMLQCFTMWNPYYPHNPDITCTAPWVNLTVTFPAGSQEAYVYVINRTIQSDTPTTTGRHYQYEYNYEGAVILTPQVEVPNCGGAPAGCIMDITTLTGQTPTQRGNDDGSIYACVTGNTGATINWFINGYEDTGSTLTCHTFTGLTGGQTYYIRAEDTQCWSQVSFPLGFGDFRSGEMSKIEPMENGNIVAVENPVILTLSTDQNSFNPVRSVNVFTVTGTISNITIGFNLSFPYPYTGQFLSKGFPDRTNYFLESILTDNIGVPLGSNTVEEICTSIAEVFQKDAILSRLYFISSFNNTVTLIAKDYGDGYDLTSSNVTITGSNLSLSNTSSGVAEWDGQLVENYSIYVELFINPNMEFNDTPNPADYVRVQELELPFNDNNIHQFDLAPALKNFVSSPKLDFTFTGVTYMSEMMASYYCKFGEKYPLIPNSNTKKKRSKGLTGYGWCMNSSLPFENQNTMNAYVGTSGVLFLNTAQNTKYSHRDSKEFLNIVIPMDYMNPLALFGTITMYHGNVYSNVKFLDITTSGFTYNFGGVATIQAGYNDLGIYTYESLGIARIRKVDLQVRQLSGGSYIGYSETKTYSFEIDEQPSNFNIAFLNSLGTYETYSFVGEVIEGQEITRSQYQKPYGVSSRGAATVGFQYNTTLDTEYTKTWTLNTGIISSDTFDFLMGMLQSNRIYHYDDQHQNYLLVKSHVATKSTNDNEYALQVVMAETIIENQVNM